MTHVKKYFRTPILAIWEMKDYNGEEQFHSKKYLFGNVSFLCQHLFENCTTKDELCNDKSYKKLYTRLQLQMPLQVSV